ncbi:MAG: hypothetical protein RXR16_00690 [Thermocladium sp.]
MDGRLFDQAKRLIENGKPRPLGWGGGQSRQAK